MSAIELQPKIHERSSTMDVTEESSFPATVVDGSSSQVSSAAPLSSEVEGVNIPASAILEAINNRPSVRLGRQQSLLRQRSTLGRRGADAIDGSSITWASPVRSRARPDSGASVPRSAAHQLGTSDLQYIAYGERLAGRRATMTLERRIEEYEGTLRRRSRAARHSVWSSFANVKWPKLKSRIQVALSYELWKGHMKQVEGNFGTAVVSYFILLRWLFLVNLAIFTLWFSFVCIPQFIWETSSDNNHTPLYDTACVFNSSDPFNCSDGPPLDFVYNTEHCILTNSTDHFAIRLCRVHDNVADQESCDGPINVTYQRLSCSQERLYICNRVRPCIKWYTYILQFITGQGFFNDTVLFLGHYSNVTAILNNDYDLPLATLILTGVVYGITFVLLVFKMGQAYNESYIEFGSGRKVNFCNKVFSAWDYNITHPASAVLKRAHIMTDLREEVADHNKRIKQRTWSELLVIIVIRLSTNTGVIVVLGTAATIIYYTAQWSLENLVRDQSFWIGLVVPTVISTLNIILPFLFSLVARVEKFKTMSGEIKMTLLRTIMVRLSSIIVLIITDYVLIKCTQKSVQQTNSTDTCDSSFYNILKDVNTTSCVKCWETFIGQEFYKLALVNSVITVCSTLVLETLQHIVYKLFYHRTKKPKLQLLVSKSTFNIPQSILDLIYTQLLLWLGFLFSPLQPAIIIITFVVTFYVKKYSLMWNLEPEKRGVFKAARTNFLFLFLLLVSLFGALVPVGYAVARLKPSNCGPFRDRPTMIYIISELINSIQECDTKLAIAFFGSSGFVIPVIILFLLVIYALIVILRARNAKFELIKTQLILEGANMAHVSYMVNTLVQQRTAMRSSRHSGAEPRGSVLGTPSGTVVTDID